MKKQILLAIFGIITLHNSQTFAQKAFTVNHFKDPAKIETDEYTIEFFDILCEKEFAKGRLRITNKTNDILAYDQSMTKGIFSFGTVENEKGKEIYIMPYGSAGRTFKFTGENMHTESFSIQVQGISRVPVAGSQNDIPPFVLPNRTNDVTMGSFHCHFEKMTKKTDKLSVTFKCDYHGKMVGLVDPSKASFIYPNNNEYANAESKSSIEIMGNGDDKKITFECSEHKKDGDLQFIEMKLNWKNAFVESSKSILGGIKVDCEFDLALTQAKNK